MSVRAPTVTLMDSSAVVSMDALRRGLPEGRRSFEVVVTAPRQDGGEPLVPRALPPEVQGCWSADEVIVSAIVLTSRRSAAVAAVETLVTEVTCAEGAAVTVRAACAGDKAPVVSAADAAAGGPL
jgi:hypothetical protein